MPIGNGNNADAGLIMADQLIAAKLSVANGSPTVQHVADSIAAADALIGGNTIPMKVKSNTVLGKKMISLATFLANYNNGAMTTGCNTVPATVTSKQNNAVNEVTNLPVTDQLEALAIPNPSKTDFTLKLRSGNANEKVIMQVMDMYGRVIEVRNVAAEQTIRLGDKYRSGIYIVKLIQGKEHKEMKLIKLSE